MSGDPRWFRSGERLPPDGVEVIGWVVEGDGEGTICICRFIYSDGHWFDIADEDCVPVIVSHWMPLPEGPQ